MPPSLNESPPVSPSSTRTSAHNAPQIFRKLALWVLGFFGVIVALIVVLAVLVAVVDWNRAKPRVNAAVSEVTGRDFAIEGDLSVAWHWPQPLEGGWHRWIPGVTVTAEKLVLDNPDGFMASKGQQRIFGRTPPQAPATAGKKAEADKQAQAAPAPSRMAHIEKVSATVRLWPLLGKVVSIKSIDLTGPDIALARTKTGANNWTFEKKEGGSSGWTVQLDRLMLREGVLGYADGMNDLELIAHIDTIKPSIDKRPALPAPADPARPSDASTPPAKATQVSDTAGSSNGTRTSNTAAAPTAATAVPYGLRFELEGRYGKAKIKGSGLAGEVISLRDKVVNYPLKVDASAGSVALAAEGVLANPGALSGLDFQVALKGASMADLYELTGLVLPSTPPFETDGRLTGSLEPQRAVWEYRKFDGKVGQSDLHGSLKYTSGKPRPRLTGEISSNKLRLADLGPALGTADADNTHKGLDPKGQRGRVLPDSKFAADRWNAMDMDITFKGQNIVRPESLPLEDLSLRAVMNNAQLKLEPLTFGVAGGKIESDMLIDGSASPLKAQIHGKVQGLQLSELFPKVQLMKKSMGRMDGAIALASRGNSIAGLLGQGTGELRLYVRDGTLSKQMLDLAALNVGSIVVGKLFGNDKEVHLRCAVADFAVVDGVANARVVKMSTDDAVIQATGTIDLGTEKLNLRIKPESLEWKFFSLRSPLYVRGTLGNPDVGVEVGPLLLRAGAAVAAAVVAPAALALLPVTVPAADDDTHCKPLLNLATAPVKSGSQGASGAATQAARKTTVSK
ncbi:MAG: AsmA family protein [Burkholderiaceae bacterium]|nr:AsmA family protein [Burkholderiaceae bacterium]